MMWGNYNMTFTVRNQARIVHYKAYDDGLTRFNVEDFEKVMRAQADINHKIVTVLNFPHNPSGYSLTREEADRVADILLDIAQSGTHVVAACDDAYFGLFLTKKPTKNPCLPDWPADMNVWLPSNWTAPPKKIMLGD